MNYKKVINTQLKPDLTLSQRPKNNNQLSLPEIKDYVTKSRNPYYFYMRFEKPLNIGDKKDNSIKTTLLYTKAQIAKMKELKEKVKKIQRQKLRAYAESTERTLKYKHMLPLPVWRKCEKTYEKLRPKVIRFIKLIKMKEEKNKENLSNINDIKKNFISYEKIKLRKIEYNKNNILLKPSINLTIRDNEEDYKKNLTKEPLDHSKNYIKFNNYDNSKKCISKINIRKKFENKGLNRFIKSVDKICM